MPKQKLMLLCSIVLSACVSGPIDSAASSANNSVWAQAAIVDYSYTLTRHCFCAPDYTRPIRLQVRDSKVVAARFVDGDKALVPQAMSKSLQSMSELLEYADALEAKKPHSLNVQLDADIGYLLRLDVDRHVNIADDELSLVITDFTAE